MDIFFQDPTEIPLPPDEVRILEFRAAPYPDGRRVRVYLEVTPFQKRPSADVSVVDSSGATAAEVSIIESMTRKMEFTIHLRTANTQGTYSLLAEVYYKSEESDPSEGSVKQGGEKMVVDRRQDEFTVEIDVEKNLPDEIPAAE
jgi:hypothetical protein